MESPIIIKITNFSIINLITILGLCGTYVTLHKPLLYMWWLEKLWNCGSNLVYCSHKCRPMDNKSIHYNVYIYIYD